MVSLSFARGLACCRCALNILEALKQEEKLRNGVEIVGYFAYMAGQMGAGGRCETAVIVMYGWPGGCRWEM